MNKLYVISVIVSILLITGCLADPTTEDLDAETLTRQGWEYFMTASNLYPITSESDYCKAIEKFDLAVYTDSNYADAFNGLGWSYLRINLYAEAYFNFVKGLKTATGETRREILIGYASALLQENTIPRATLAKDFLENVVFGKNLLLVEGDELESTWSFKRDPNIRDSNVHMNLAWAYIYTSRNYATDSEKRAIIGYDDDAEGASTAWGQYYSGQNSGEIGTEELNRLFNALKSFE